LLAFHKELIRLRKSLPALRSLSKDKMDVLSFEKECVLAVRRWSQTNEVLAIFNFNEHPVQQFENVPRGAWTKRFDSSDSRWLGSGTTAPGSIQSPMQLDLTLEPYGVLLYEKEIQD